jgi:hypothetical protein
METAFKGRFPLQPYTVTERSIFFCLEVVGSTSLLRKQRHTLRFGTSRLHTYIQTLFTHAKLISRLISMGGVKYTINNLQKIRKYKRKTEVRLYITGKRDAQKNTEI